jgi:predicted Zn-dependent protease
VTKVYLQVLGEVDGDIMARLVPCLEERTLFTFSLQPILHLGMTAIPSGNRRFFTAAILESIRRTLPPDGNYVLGIAGADLVFHPDIGETRFHIAEGRVGLIYLGRLSDELVRSRPVGETIFSRLLKECLTTLGHLVGCRPCHDSSCVMYCAHSAGEIDRKGTIYCAQCDRILRRLSGII